MTACLWGRASLGCAAHREFVRQGLKLAALRFEKDLAKRSGRAGTMPGSREDAAVVRARRARWRHVAAHCGCGHITAADQVAPSTVSVTERRPAVAAGIRRLHSGDVVAGRTPGCSPGVSRCRPRRSFRRSGSCGTPALPRPPSQPPIPAGRSSGSPQGASSRVPPSVRVALQQWSAALKFVASAAKVTLRFETSSMGILAVVPSLASIAGVCVLGSLT